MPFNREDLTISNMCDGNLDALFQDAMRTIEDDISRRPNVLEKRRLTMVIEFTPEQNGFIAENCWVEHRLPKNNKCALAALDGGRIVQLREAQAELKLAKGDDE